jgi:hypothetical protein
MSAAFALLFGWPVAAAFGAAPLLHPNPSRIPGGHERSSTRRPAGSAARGNLLLLSPPRAATFHPPFHTAPGASSHGGAAPSSEQISDLVRAVYPRHALKLLARLMGAPIGTAKHWLYVHFPAARTADVARALLPELARRREEFEQTARRIEQLARGED